MEETANGDMHERIREADLERHLDNDKEKLAPKEAAPAKPQSKKGKGGKDDEEEPPTPAFEIASKSDYQLSQAMNLLKAWQVIRQR